MNICVFASGTGTNFEAIVNSARSGYLKSKVSLLITNNSKCGAVKIAEANGIAWSHISRVIYPDLTDRIFAEKFLNELEKFKIDFIVMAGYMKSVPDEVIRRFNGKIINIHPALLPSFGGKGMYGINVHRAVIESGVKVSGITVHFVEGEYDKGKIIFQKCCDVAEDDDEVSLQKKIQQLEHKYYPEVIRTFEQSGQ